MPIIPPLTGKLVLHHRDHGAEPVRAGRHDLVDEETLVLLVGGNERFLADVGGKFVLCHMQHLSAQLGDDQQPVLRLALFQDKLDDIVLRNVSGREKTSKMDALTPN